MSYRLLSGVSTRILLFGFCAIALAQNKAGADAYDLSGPWQITIHLGHTRHELKQEKDRYCDLAKSGLEGHETFYGVCAAVKDGNLQFAVLAGETIETLQPLYQCQAPYNPQPNTPMKGMCKSSVNGAELIFSAIRS